MRCCFGGLFIQWEQPVMCVCHILSFALAYIVHSILKGAPSAPRFDCAKSCLIFLFFFFCFHSLLARRCCLQVACIRASWPLAHASHTFATNMNGWLRFSLVVRRISRFSCQILACWPNGFRFSDVSPAKPCWAHLLSVGRLVGRACSGSSDCCHWAPPRWCLLYRPEEFHLCMLLHKHYSGFAVQQNAFLLCVCVWECKSNTHTGLHILHIHYIEDEWSAV